MSRCNFFVPSPPLIFRSFFPLAEPAFFSRHIVSLPFFFLSRLIAILFLSISFFIYGHPSFVRWPFIDDDEMKMVKTLNINRRTHRGPFRNFELRSSKTRKKPQSSSVSYYKYIILVDISCGSNLSNDQTLNGNNATVITLWFVFFQCNLRRGRSLKTDIIE